MNSFPKTPHWKVKELSQIVADAIGAIPTVYNKMHQNHLFDERSEMPTNPNIRYTPDGQVESEFREKVRDLIGLDFSARDEQIYARLRELKKFEDICRDA